MTKLDDDVKKVSSLHKNYSGKDGNFKRDVELIKSKTDWDSALSNPAIDHLLSEERMMRSVMGNALKENFIALTQTKPDALIPFEKSHDDDVNDIMNLHNKEGTIGTVHDGMYNAVSVYEEFGINSMNRWIVMFGENKMLSDENRLLLSQYIEEVNFPAVDISVKDNDLGFGKNSDVEAVVFSEISLTARLDDNMTIQKILSAIAFKERNHRTGRFGYKDDYKFDSLDFMIYNSLNQFVYGVHLVNVILSQTGDLTGTYGESESAKVSFSMDFDEIEYVYPKIG